MTRGEVQAAVAVTLKRRPFISYADISAGGSGSPPHMTTVSEVMAAHGARLFVDGKYSNGHWWVKAEWQDDDEAIFEHFQHPAAAIFPLMKDEELDVLAADIKAHGQREEILVWDGQILDGRNRFLACRRGGVSPTIAEVAPRSLAYGQIGGDGNGGSASGFSPSEYVFAANIARRHLTASQKAALGAELANRMRAERAAVRAARKKREDLQEQESARVGAMFEGMLAGVLGDGRTRELAAKAVGSSPTSVARAEKVMEVSPALHEQVKEGEVTVREAHRRVTARKDHWVGVDFVVIPALQEVQRHLAMPAATLGTKEHQQALALAEDILAQLKGWQFPAA